MNKAKANKKKSKKKPGKNKGKNIAIAKKKKKIPKKSVITEPTLPPVAEKIEIWKKNYILAAIVFVLVAGNLWFYASKKWNGENQQKQAENELAATEANANDNVEPPKSEEEIKNEKIVQALLWEKEAESWKTYQNKIYGFELKYPRDWPEPAVVKREGEAKYQYKVSFRNTAEENGRKGFDVAAYRSLKKNGNMEPEYTDHLSIKESAAENYENCLEPDVHEIGPNKYPAIEIAALKDDPCFSEAYFFSMQKNNFIFDIVPFPEGGIGYPGYDGEEKVAETLPEFDKILSTFKFMMVAAKKTTAVPRITAPKPVADLKISNGKRMCAKKNDKPRKSKQKKGKHMDMECCLDPDEIPNPWCTY